MLVQLTMSQVCFWLVTWQKIITDKPNKFGHIIFVLQDLSHQVHVNADISRSDNFSPEACGNKALTQLMHINVLQLVSIQLLVSDFRVREH